jgi:hypothetical protein
MFFNKKVAPKRFYHFWADNNNDNNCLLNKSVVLGHI